MFRCEPEPAAARWSPLEPAGEDMSPLSEIKKAVRAMDSDPLPVPPPLSAPRSRAISAHLYPNPSIFFCPELKVSTFSFNGGNGGRNFAHMHGAGKVRRQEGTLYDLHSESRNPILGHVDPMISSILHPVLLWGRSVSQYSAEHGPA